MTTMLSLISLLLIGVMVSGAIDMSATGILSRESSPSVVIESANVPVLLTTENKTSTISTTKITSEDMYKKMGACLANNIHAAGKNLNSMKIPADAEEHYKELLEKTKVMRGVPHHGYASFHGPWIENHFIDHFISKPFSFFNGLVPLFVQFVDIHCYDFLEAKDKNASIPTPVQTVDMLLQWLRHDVIYLVVSQDDQGIGLKLLSQFPNILVMSAGGYGHIPIPLIKGVMDYKEPNKDNKYTWETGFYGNTRPALSRSRMLAEMQSACNGVQLKYHSSQSADWAQLLTNTKFNLAPRGYGRTSFRLAEIVQSGRVPVYMYDDAKWVPYEGTKIAISTFGYIGKHGSLKATANEMKSTSDEAYSAKVQQAKAVREYYTYEGVIKQIELFFSDPLGESNYLRCERVPDKDHRRLGGGGLLRGNESAEVEEMEPDVHWLEATTSRNNVDASDGDLIDSSEITDVYQPLY